MLKRLSMLVVATLVVTFMCVDTELVASSRGDVLFRHTSSYAGLNPEPYFPFIGPTFERHRLWSRATAIHRPERGRSVIREFFHVHDAEEHILFRNQPTGSAQGRVIIERGPVCSPSKCLSEWTRPYTVIANRRIEVFLRAQHRR